MKTKILARTVVYDQTENKILLVRNKNTDFWYIPGGGWEHESETIIECAAREVLEETGLSVTVGKFLYLQEFHDVSRDLICFETFWLASVSNTTLDDKHEDMDPNGQVQESRWFSKEELEDKTIFPKRLKTTFWDTIKNILEEEDRFIGVS